MCFQRRRQTFSHGNMSQSPSLRRGDMPLPIGVLHAELPLVKVDVTPFERHDLPQPQPSISTEEHQ